MTNVADEFVQLWGQGPVNSIHAQEIGWQSGLRSCIMPGLPAHLVHEFNAGTVERCV